MNSDWLNTRDSVGETPLMRVSRSGRMEIANIMFFQTIEDAMKEVSHLPALHRAAFWGYDDAIEDLVSEGADPNSTDAQGETPLHKAARLGNTSAIEALVKLGASVDTPNAVGLTPLHWAALTGQSEAVQTLLHLGANPQVRDWVTGGMTPADFARLMRFEEVLDILDDSMGIQRTHSKKRRGFRCAI